jgi:hypothetical protein
LVDKVVVGDGKSEFHLLLWLKLPARCPESRGLLF